MKKEHAFLYLALLIFAAFMFYKAVCFKDDFNACIHKKNDIGLGYDEAINKTPKTEIEQIKKNLEKEKKNEYC